VTTVTGGAVASTANRYFVLDHLGSTAVITKDDGSVDERLAYDPWGRRRNLDGSDDTAGTIRSQTNRGFTSHEMIDDVGLINMNARVYDPVLGRFMAADPVTVTPYDAQSLNRYSYVDNRPLSLTDLTGLAPKSSSCGQGMTDHDCKSMDANDRTDGGTKSAYHWRAQDGTLVDGGGVDKSGWTHPGRISNDTNNPGRSSDSNIRVAYLANGRDVGTDATARVVSDAQNNWIGTPYAPRGTPQQGSGAICKIAADCSGSVWKIFNDNGLPFPYRTTSQFEGAASQPGFPFRALGPNDTIRPGDVILYPGHMSFYGGNGMVYSAHRTGRNFDIFPIDYFGKHYRAFRYQVPSQ
jgi:RHS repeat-associated protein